MKLTNTFTLLFCLALNATAFAKISSDSAPATDKMDMKHAALLEQAIEKLEGSSMEEKLGGLPTSEITQSVSAALHEILHDRQVGQLTQTADRSNGSVPTSTHRYACVQAKGSFGSLAVGTLGLAVCTNLLSVYALLYSPIAFGGEMHAGGGVFYLQTNFDSLASGNNNYQCAIADASYGLGIGGAICEENNDGISKSLRKSFWLAGIQVGIGVGWAGGGIYVY